MASDDELEALRRQLRRERGAVGASYGGNAPPETTTQAAPRRGRQGTFVVYILLLAIPIAPLVFVFGPGVFSDRPSLSAAPQSLDTTDGPESPSRKRGRAKSNRLQGAATTIRKHFLYLRSGSYRSAFALMSPEYRRKNASWPVSRAQADPQILRFRIGQPKAAAGSGAYVPVSFFARDLADTTGSDLKCRHFRGRAYVMRFGSTWLYEPKMNVFTRSVVQPLRCR